MKNIKLICLFAIFNVVHHFHSNAQIIYADINPDSSKTASVTIVGTPVSVSGFFNLDLNNDGINDFKIKVNCTRHSGLGSSLNFSRGVTVQTYNNNAIAVYDSTFANSGFPLALSTNVIIKEQKWQTQLTTSAVLRSAFTTNGIPFYGAWPESVDRYLGLKLKVGALTYYGWVRILIDLTSNSAKYIVKDYTYNSIPNQSILAGETSCTIPTITTSAGGPLSFCTGDSVIFTANSAGYQYQWKKDNVNISGANSKSYAAKTAGGYKCKVTNSCGSKSSGIKTVTIPCRTIEVEEKGDPFEEPQPEIACNCSAPNYGCLSGNFGCSMACALQCRSCAMNPTITAGDTLTFCIGDSVILTANRGGTGLIYQWKKDSVIISGATQKTYVAKTSGNYQCSVKNNCNSKTTTGIEVKVEVLPTLSLTKTGPLSFCTGDSVTFTAVTAASNYQWKKDNVNIAGATFQSFTANTAGAYKCKVTNSCGFKSSGIKTVTIPCRTTEHEEPFEISEEPEIAVACNCQVPGYGCGLNEACHIVCHSICHPVNYCAYTTTITASDSLTFCTGDSVKLTASRTGASSYQWQKDTVNIPGATTKTITVFSSGSYRCKATNSCNINTSSAKAITVELPSALTVTKNGPLSFCAGDSVVFAAVTTAQYFQWKKNNSNIAGATFQSYTAKTAGAYKCKVTNSCGSKSSGIKTVTIPCRNSIENFSEIIEHLLVYPNPATNSVTIKFPSEEPGEMQIANLFGQIISSEKIFSDETKIDVRKFSEGIYLIRWNSGVKFEIRTFTVIK